MNQPILILLFLPFYGITVMAGLLNIQRSNFHTKNTLCLILFTLLTIIINIFVCFYLGYNIYRKFYILWIQLPLYVGFWIISKYRGVKLLFALLTTITLASLPVHFVIVLRIVSKGNNVLIAFGFLAAYLTMLFLVFVLLRPNFVYMLEYGENKSFWKFCLIPFIYYIYGFLSSGYNFTQYARLDTFILGRIPDIIVFISYILLVDIFKKTYEKQLLERDQAMMAMQIESATKQIESLRTNQEQVILYRHDMRHHISLISTLLANGEIQKAQEYLYQEKSQIDAITPIHYCENETINLILASFISKATQKDITLSIEANLPNQLYLPEMELCALLSNGLENAIVATSKLEDPALRKVYLNCRISENRLLIYMENSYSDTVVLENGLPKSNNETHGFGTKSIASIVAKRNGYCSYEVEEKCFILRIVIPLK